LFSTIIEKKRAELREKKAAKMKDRDLVTLMLEATDEQGTLTTQDLKNNLAVFYLAGHETTAYSLTAAVYYLAINQEIQDKARADVINVLGDSPNDVIPTARQSKSFDYLNQVIKETLRLESPATAILTRMTAKPVQMGGIEIPVGTKLTVDIWSMHHNPAVWGDDADTYRPERWAENTGNKDFSAWMPFGGGSRICLGMQFSLIEQRVVLAMLLRKYTWTLPPNSPHSNGFKLLPGVNGLQRPESLDINFERRY